MVTVALAVLLGAGVAAGLSLLLGTLFGLTTPIALTRTPHLNVSSIDVARLALGGFAGVSALAITRWPLALPLAFLGVFALRGLGGAPAGPAITRLEAIASWTEMLRDTLAGAAGLTQALTTTAAISPKPIRSEVSTLSARLGSGVELTHALSLFAAELGDPAGDILVAALTMAARERAQRLSELLSALADTVREEVAMRQGIEASRSSARTSVRTVTGFSLGLVGLMAVLARSYLAPYRTPTGQLMLALVGVVFGIGLWLMSAMVRPRLAGRLFSAGASS